MDYLNIEQIIYKCINDITSDLSSLEGIKSIDFLDIFPRSEAHKIFLDAEANKIANIIEKTERGNFYVFHKPVNTKFGELKVIKIRKFDNTRLNWIAAPDFSMEDYNKFLNRYINDNRFIYIEKPTYKGLEFKTKNSLIYFLDIPTTTYYNIK